MPTEYREGGLDVVAGADAIATLPFDGFLFPVARAEAGVTRVP